VLTIVYWCCYRGAQWQIIAYIIEYSGVNMYVNMPVKYISGIDYLRLYSSIYMMRSQTRIRCQRCWIPSMLRVVTSGVCIILTVGDKMQRSNCALPSITREVVSSTYSWHNCVQTANKSFSSLLAVRRQTSGGLQRLLNKYSNANWKQMPMLNYCIDYHWLLTLLYSLYGRRQTVIYCTNRSLAV